MVSAVWSSCFSSTSTRTIFYSPHFTRPRPRTRTRTRRRSVWQRASLTLYFDYEDEHDDEDDLSTLRMATQGDRPFDFAMDECSFIRGFRCQDTKA